MRKQEQVIAKTKRQTPFSIDPVLWELAKIAHYLDVRESECHEFEDEKVLERLKEMAPEEDDSTLYIARCVADLYIHQQRAIERIEWSLDVEDPKLKDEICAALRAGDFQSAFDQLMGWVPTHGEPVPTNA